MENVQRYLVRLDGLMREGRELRALLATDDSGRSTEATRVWQQHCAETIHELSGGSKAHWLSRAFSEALLVPSPLGHAVQEVALADIVDRLVGVLGQARASLTSIVRESGVQAVAAPHPKRFDFVHDASLRPVLEQAYVTSRAALDEGRFAESLITVCSILEAVITDALEYSGRNAREWSFERRIGEAEQAGLIRGSCTRLPPIACRYRDLPDADGNLRDDLAVTARDARVTSQVLQVLLRDLDPGR